MSLITITIINIMGDRKVVLSKYVKYHTEFESTFLAPDLLNKTIFHFDTDDPT